MRENFQITDSISGKAYWISRAHAVAGFVMFKNTIDDEWNFLLEKRGPNCPDHVGKWCGVCGYLNWGETRKEAFIRECYEETGLTLSNDNVLELCVIDDPKRDARENIVTRYAAIVSAEEIREKIRSGVINTSTFSRGGETGEVSDLQIFSLSEINRMNSNDFAFNHKEVIFEIVDMVKYMMKPWNNVKFFK